MEGGGIVCGAVGELGHDGLISGMGSHGGEEHGDGDECGDAVAAPLVIGDVFLDELADSHELRGIFVDTRVVEEAGKLGVDITAWGEHGVYDELGDGGDLGVKALRVVREQNPASEALEGRVEAVKVDGGGNACGRHAGGAIRDLLLILVNKRAINGSDGEGGIGSMTNVNGLGARNLRNLRNLRLALLIALLIAPLKRSFMGLTGTGIFLIRVLIRVLLRALLRV